MKKIIIMVFAVLVLTSCEKLVDLNKDIKNPQEVQAGTLFANATIELFDFMASTNVNVNNFRLYAQQWAQTTYADESNYELVERNVNGAAWNRLYTRVIRDAREARTIIADDPFLSAEQIAAQQAMCDVIEVVAFHTLVDLFGDIPYSAAFTDDVTPAYDDDKAIYGELFTKLDAAITALSGDANTGMGASDLIFGGNGAAWKTFANSLKLRMAIRIADADNATAMQKANEAISSGVMASSADDFELQYTSSTPHTNPLWVDLIQSGRSDFIAASTIVDPMKDLDDPRIDDFFSDTYEVIDTVAMDTTIEYLGGVYGDNNNYNAFSHPGANQVDPTFPGTILSYTEVEFLLADAAERGYNAPGSAGDHYEAGIRSSIAEWGGTDTEADTYYASADVDYATAPGNWKEKIAFQKWLALYDQGFEAWTTYRLYDAPYLPMAVQAQRFPPRRYTYPVTEYSLNEVSVAAGATAIGGDNLDSRVFWDVN